MALTQMTQSDAGAEPATASGSSACRATKIQPNRPNARALAVDNVNDRATPPPEVS